MAVQLKETLEHLIKQKKNRKFGPWRINVPKDKRALLNCLNLWFLLLRIFDKLKTLLRMIPFKSFSLHRSTKSKKKKTKTLERSKSKKQLLDDVPMQIEKKKTAGFAQPRKPSEKSFDLIPFNWKFFSENYYYPSIFIQNQDFVSNTLHPIILNPELCLSLVDLAQDFLDNKPKDKFNRKLLKYFLRLMITFDRDHNQDIKILEYLSNLIAVNKACVKKGRHFPNT